MHWETRGAYLDAEGSAAAGGVRIASPSQWHAKRRSLTISSTGAIDSVLIPEEEVGVMRYFESIANSFRGYPYRERLPLALAMGCVLTWNIYHRWPHDFRWPPDERASIALIV